MGRKSNGRVWAFCGAALAVGLALTYPYLVPVVGLVIGSTMLLLAWQARRIPWSDWLNGGIILVPLFPFLFYYGYWVQQDPNWKFTHFTHNIIPPPNLLFLMVGFGILAILALIGGWYWTRQKAHPLILVWAIVNLGMIYLPLPYTGRFLLGLIIPVGTLAAYGLEAGILVKIRGDENGHNGRANSPRDRGRRIILLLTIPSTLMVALFLAQIALFRPDYPIYLPEADAEAAAWLAENIPDSAIVLAAYPVGNYLPRLSGASVFVGQPFLTLNLEEKVALLAQFWDEDTPPAWRQTFLSEWHITHIYDGVHEQTLQTGDITPPGELIYEADGVKIYQVSEP